VGFAQVGSASVSLTQLGMKQFCFTEIGSFSINTIPLSVSKVGLTQELEHRRLTPSITTRKHWQRSYPRSFSHLIKINWLTHILLKHKR
jgi:hypothetical protein